ncbi:DUF3800 domain-containing protein [Citromicrobium bathyomarinum]|uniref:DUF3800 domain-containing protein n=1 Tax=Citromicrobium bathyomarinum TaxID=72174 RepID=UPI001E4E693C|nr:DUF3800 domain-containing protein [Citromicrobium bathyomarinum]MCD1624302.1 DUF3800 domain-containing protein [Citromicrobium bathyomarinum]
MARKYTLLIDESGQWGLRKIRSESEKGASPYMAFGAALIPNSERAEIEDKLLSVTSRIGKSNLHCSNLRHSQIVYFSRQIIQHLLRFFGVISYKHTLRDYTSHIDGDHNKYYNKCAQYLLERVGWFLELRGIEAKDVDIVFEKANCDYNMMRKFLRRLQSNPKHSMTAKLKHIDIEAIEAIDKSEEALFQVADLVAHSLFKCVDKNDENFYIPETRYLSELAPRFFGDPESNKISGAGLYCVHTPDQIELDADVKAVITGLEASPK